MKFCVDVDIHDIITCKKFGEDWLRGLGVATGQISGVIVGPYNNPA